jgi:flavin-binding protein dodecin
MPEQFSTGAIKIIEIMGVSATSFEDAVDEAVSKAAESINAITGVEVVRQTADVRDGKVSAYCVTLKLSFIVR